jgi:hypothetical protein
MREIRDVSPLIFRLEALAGRAESGCPGLPAHAELWHQLTWLNVGVQDSLSRITSRIPT